MDEISDMPTEQKAEEFGRMGVLLLLSAMAMCGSLALLSNPAKVQTTLEQAKEMIWLGIKDFRQAARLITVENVDTLLAYVRGLAEEDALAVLKEAASGKDIRQLHKLAKLVREASKEVEGTLQKDTIIVALENWKETGSIKKALQAVGDWVKWRNIGENAFEIYYRTMSQADYEYLCMTGKLSPTGETFISPTQSFSNQYEGVTVRFEMSKGTTTLLEKIGLSNGDRAILAKAAYPNMSHVSGIKWTKEFAFFKAEGSQINIGLGKGKALDIFNKCICSFGKVD